MQELRGTGKEKFVVLNGFEIDVVADAPAVRAAVAGYQIDVVVLHFDARGRAIGIGPALAIEFGEGSAAPLEAGHTLGAVDTDVHHRPGAGFDLADIAERDLGG